MTRCIVSSAYANSQAAPIQINLPIFKDFEYTGEYRTPKGGEFFLFFNDLFVEIHRNDGLQIFTTHFIVRKVWEPKKEDFYPKPGYIAMDSNGQWHWFSCKPRLNESSGCWVYVGIGGPLSSDIFDLPKSIDWKESLRTIS